MRIGLRGLVAAFGAALVAATLPSLAPLPGGGGTAFAQQATANVLRIRLGSDITSFDPHRPSTIENTTASVHIFDGLFGYDLANMSIQPRLAREYSVSEDGLTYTFRLREGVQFHRNFGELTADDVKFSLERVLNPATASPWRSELRNIAAISTEGRHTVVIRLSAPNANFLHALTGRNQALIVSRRAVEQLGNDWARNPVGTGAYTFEAWRPGERVILRANDAYFRGRSPIDRVELVVIPEETSAEIALLNREIDVFFALQAPEVIQRLQGRAGFTVDSRPALISCHLVLNNTVRPLNDVRVRRAMAHAINRESLVRDFFRGTKVLTATPLTPEYPEYTTDVPQYPYDPARARALLAEAGLANGFDFHYVTVALAPFDQFPVAVAEDLKAVGIRVRLTVMERAAYGAARASGNLPSATTCPSNSPSPDTLLRGLLHSDGFPPGVNTARYSGADQMLDAAQRAQNPQERLRHYHAAQRQIMTDVPVIPLYADRLFTARHNGVQGVLTSAAFWVDSYGATVRR